MSFATMPSPDVNKNVGLSSNVNGLGPSFGCCLPSLLDQLVISTVFSPWFIFIANVSQ